ncbi:MAG: hypothetical protein SV375_05165 [Thermodesulfobacteriota bacterium]|nr:hypothetical protein [Thermodesulfobacteriota bacterium]
MKFEVRRTLNDRREPVVKGLILISESEEESKYIDMVFGGQPDDDGLIGVSHAEARLSDGYRKHYIYIPVNQETTKKKLGRRLTQMEMVC